MNIKDGDYFSYSWKPSLGPSSDSYWCRDRKCVARTNSHGDIVLIDTYNYWPFKDGKEDTTIFTHEGLAREYSKYIDIERFDLDFICNLNDYEFVHEYAKNDYEGVVFVGYQCTKKWAKPKGNDVSKAAVLKKLEAQLQRTHEDLRSAERTITRINEQIEELK
jgi:hypothetical protein